MCLVLVRNYLLLDTWPGAKRQQLCYEAMWLSKSVIYDQVSYRLPWQMMLWVLREMSNFEDNFPLQQFFRLYDPSFIQCLINFNIYIVISWQYQHDFYKLSNYVSIRMSKIHCDTAIYFQGQWKFRNSYTRK